jgi:hypothetical protein
MFTDAQLRNFRRYLKMVPPQLHGAARDQLKPLGAYDSGLRAPAHGLDPRDFARGGAFDAEGGIGRDVVEKLMAFLKGKLNSGDLAKLEDLLRADRSPDDAQDDEDMAAKVADFCEAKGLSDADARELMQLVNPGPDDTGADDPPDFAGKPEVRRTAPIEGMDERPRPLTGAALKQLAEFNKAHGIADHRIKVLGDRGGRR